MSDESVHVWLPQVTAGSGSDVFTERLAASLRLQGAKVTITRFPRWTQYLPAIALRRELPPSVDVVIANSWQAFAFASLGVPVIAVELHPVGDPVHLRYVDPMRRVFYKLFGERFVKKSMATSSAVVAISAYTAEALTAAFSGIQLQVIRPGLDLDLYRPLRQPTSSTGMHRVFFAGNQSPRKGADLLPAIAALLGPGFELRATGGLRGRRSPHSEGVTYLGTLSESELIEEYGRADVVLVPSRLEGFGYVAAEAMACGTPVVATDGSALPELIRDGVDGRLCPLDDVQAFAEAIRWCCSDEARNDQLGNAARSRAVSLLSLERVGSEYVRLISDCTRNKS